MSRALLRLALVAAIAAFAGIAMSAAAFALIPDPGSAPSIFDAFSWSSTANGFWHVNPSGATDTIKSGKLTLSGSLIELDRRLQTDPNVTVVSLRIRGLKYRRFGVGLGVWHAGTIGMEFDDDGVKCGRASDYGYQVDIMKPVPPPAGQWVYLEMSVVNPYPDPKSIPQNINDRLLKRVKFTCSMYDSQGRLLARDYANDPPPNTHYVGLDEAYMRTWDTANKYQIDWFYAGPRAGNPLNGIVPPKVHQGA